MPAARRRAFNLLACSGVRETTPAPLDPSKVKAGDTVTVRVAAMGDTPEFEVIGPVYGDGGMDLAVGDYMLHHKHITLTDHQPAPKPEPTGPQFGHALVDGQSVHGFLTTHHGDAEYHPVFVFPMPDGGYMQASGEGFSDFVPDETRPLPTTEQAVEAIQKRLSWASIHWGTKELHPDALPPIADAVLALVRGGSR